LPTRKTRSIAPDEAKLLVQDGVLALDVREPSEFDAGHLDQAMNLPLGRLAKSSAVISVGAPVIAYCGHGERSTTGISLLERSGVEAWNLEGGYEAWR
jgi:rhodanese-related sulfurtransferase